jgi:phosphoribosylglycinamide formyltransferase-1
VSHQRKRTAILISGRGSNMRALIEAACAPSYPAEICLVLSNRPDAPGLAFAKANGIAVAVVDHKIHAGREDFERSMQILLELHRIDLVCLAGFMRLLTPWFIGQWRGRLVNIHPSLLPAYRGLHTHARALADGVTIHGCTVHFVVEAMDEGPIIAQAAVPVLETDTPETLAARVLAQEHVAYPAALAQVASGAYAMQGNRVLVGELAAEPPPLLVPPAGSSEPEPTSRREITTKQECGAVSDSIGSDTAPGSRLRRSPSPSGCS